MGKAWVKRWSPEGAGHRKNLIEGLNIEAFNAIEKMTWRLPPSKSHLIRWLVLAAQSNQTITIRGVANAGQDAQSMRRCLMQLGVRFEDIDEHDNTLSVIDNRDLEPHPQSVAWRVYGVGPEGFHPPVSVLHAGNSGTALRFLMAIAARFDRPTMLDGDASLRGRNHSEIIEQLNQFSIACSQGTQEEGLPLLVQGPWIIPQEFQVQIQSTSQSLSGWLLASAAMPSSTSLQLIGKAVSQRHSALTLDLCRQVGAPYGDEMPEDLKGWTPFFKDQTVHIPPDASMMSFAFLACQALKLEIGFENAPRLNDSIGHEILLEHAQAMGISYNDGNMSPTSTPLETEVNLRDANDLITPLAALMALAGGGQIVGAKHAAFKESNRLTRTQSLLQQFGLKCELNDDGLTIGGGQHPVPPKDMVETHGDHRLHMTALVLALAVPGVTFVESSTLHCVADPSALKRWTETGATIETTLNQP